MKYLVFLLLFPLLACAGVRTEVQIDTVWVEGDTTIGAYNATFLDLHNASAGSIVASRGLLIGYIDATKDTSYRVGMVTDTVNDQQSQGNHLNSGYLWSASTIDSFRISAMSFHVRSLNGRTTADDPTGKVYATLGMGQTDGKTFWAARTFSITQFPYYRLRAWHTDSTAFDSVTISTSAAWYVFDVPESRIQYFDSSAHVTANVVCRWTAWMLVANDYRITSDADNSGRDVIDSLAGTESATPAYWLVTSNVYYTDVNKREARGERPSPIWKGGWRGRRQ